MKSRVCKFFLPGSYFKVSSGGYSSCSYHIKTEKAHGHDLKLATSVAVQSDAITSNCDKGRFVDVCRLFEEVSNLDVVSATAVIGRVSRLERHEEAIFLFSRMLLLNIRPSEFTFGTVLHSSIALRDLDVGKQLHACAVKLGLPSNVFVGSAVLDLYAKLGSIEEAKSSFEDTSEPNVVSYTTLMCGYLQKERFEDALRLFKEMPERNVVSWNAMIGGYSQTGHNEEAVNLFVEMLREGFLPNQSTFPCAFSAAANIATLGIGIAFHACAVKSLGKVDVFVGNSLISFYAKCGCMEDSLSVFTELPKRNVVSWNAVICGYAQNGRAKEALSFFQEMQVSGLRPNSVTLLGVLWACNHAGLVNEGYFYFNKARMKDHLMLKPEHYACMVDLLSRSGNFQEAGKFLCDLPFVPGIGFWKAMLGGCQIHSNVELGEYAARRILALDPEDASSYVMLSNAHSAAGRWQNVSTIRKEMSHRRLKRVPGCSWIEIRNKVSVFVTGDNNHENKDDIYAVLASCIEHVREVQASKFANRILN